MMSQVSKRALAAAFGVALLSSQALWAEEATVKEVDVDVEIQAAEGSNALNFYPNVEDDLKRAVVAKLPVENDPNGYVVDVVLQKISLDGDTVLPDSMEFNQMEGVIVITSPLTGAAPQSVPVKLAATSADGLVPEGYVAVSPSTDDFYAAMVETFASVVAERVPEFMRNAASK